MSKVFLVSIALISFVSGQSLHLLSAPTAASLFLSQIRKSQRLLEQTACDPGCSEGFICYEGKCKVLSLFDDVEYLSPPAKSLEYEFLGVIYLGGLIAAVITVLFLKLIYDMLFAKKQEIAQRESYQNLHETEERTVQLEEIVQN